MCQNIAIVSSQGNIPGATADRTRTQLSESGIDAAKAVRHLDRNITPRSPTI